MKRMAIFAMFLVTLVGITQVAGAATAEKKKAILFNFDGLYLDNYDSGYGIGMRYWMNEGTALRPMLGFRYRTDKFKQEKPATTNTDDKYTYNNVDFSLALEKHWKPGDKVSPYCGLGASVGMGSSKYEPSVSTPAPGAGTKEDKTTNTSFGGFGLLGFDWSFVDNLSVGGEYRIGVNSYTSKREVTDFTAANNYESKQTTLNLDSRSASLYLSFSF